jgi:hypothetical protein
MNQKDTPTQFDSLWSFERKVDHSSQRAEANFRNAGFSMQITAWPNWSLFDMSSVLLEGRVARA